MIHRRLLEELEDVAGRCRRFYLWAALAIGWSAAALVGLGLLLVAWQSAWTPWWAGPLVAAVALLATLLGATLATRWARDPRQVARRVEHRHPDLDNLLLTAVEQRPAISGGRFGYLQESVIRQALNHARRKRWHETVPSQRLRAVQLAGFTVLTILMIEGRSLWHGHQQAKKAGVAPSAAWSAEPYRVTVAPGDAQIERNTSLVVTARFDGPLPDDAALVCRQPKAAPSRLPMSPSLSDPMFGARIEAVADDLTYRVEYARQATRDYRVAVFDYPELLRADARLVFPGYTGMAEKRVEDTRRVIAVEGTRIALDCRLNKPVKTAQLVGENGPIDLARGPGDGAVYSASWTLRKSGRYRLQLVDDRDRRNKHPPALVFQVLPNRPADVKVVAPARDLRVSPLEEMQTKATVWDDIGLRASGITYSLAGKPPTEVVLGQQHGGNQRTEIAYQVDFEALKAEPDQLLCYYFWAEDIGPDGQPRRTSGDMYFAEVRHFEEIFRQGEQPGDQSQQDEQQGQQRGGNARQAEELAEKQKQIINATWAVIRRETAAQPGAEFSKDTGELAAAQRQALEQAEELAEKLEDPESQRHMAAVTEHMRQALALLTAAAESAAPAALQPALVEEQAAYQALLKLRARQHRVSRGNPRQRGQSSTSASNAQSRFQQALDQLELQDSENRYETQRQARSPQDAADRENREVLSRLRDLARRQGDLNERLKELQSALQEAQTEQQRQEIAQQLKRLRDNQQQMIRDTDDLLDRMQQPENQERMAQPRDRLQNTRENLRQATEALREGQVSQAVASGTRAQRELDEMRDQLRRQASGRFSDDASRLRQSARSLDENERALSERLRALREDQPAAKSLRDAGGRKEVSADLQRQKGDLGRLLDDMQQVVEEAEESEPLLSQQLYDTLRQARQEKLDNAMDTARLLVDRGLVDPAGMVEARAGQGISRLKEGVEKAAQGVLGDETAALRRAHEVLRDLAEQVSEEIRRGEGMGPGRGQEEDAQRRRARSAEEAQPADRRQPDSLSLRRPARPDGRSAPDEARATERSPAAGRETAAPPGGPIAGADFLSWSEQLRDVEEMVDDADLRARAARVRDQARGIRRDLRRRNFQGPQWDLVRRMVAEPLAELRDRVAEELARRAPQETLVPLDRDPVPSKYSEQVRRYYERLGSGQ